MTTAYLTLPNGAVIVADVEITPIPGLTGARGPAGAYPVSATLTRDGDNLIDTITVVLSNSAQRVYTVERHPVTNKATNLTQTG